MTDNPANPRSIGTIQFLPSILWLLIWLGINSGPWVLYDSPKDLLEWAHYARTLFPPVVLLVALLGILGGKRGAGLPRCVWAWAWYGVVGLAASAMTPDPFFADFWGVCYLSVFAALAMYLKGPAPVVRAAEVNRWTWIIATVFILILLATARDQLLENAARGETGYAIDPSKGAAGTALSRSSGMARFLAVPGIVALVYAVAPGGLLRVLWGAVAAACGGLLIFFQSRGAIFGYAVAVPFVFLTFRPVSRWMGWSLIALALMAFLCQGTDDSFLEKAESYLRRGQSSEDLYSMTGRTRDWQRSLEYIEQSPIYGWGFQADRWFMNRHVHNTYLYTLMTAGLLGTVAFVFGLGRVWLAFFRVLDHVPPNKRLVLIQCGALLAFFTVRSIPEVSGAMFGVDLMVMLPAMAYIGVLDRQYMAQRQLPTRHFEGKRPASDPGPTPKGRGE